jgi:hypothetical protein
MISIFWGPNGNFALPLIWIKKTQLSWNGAQFGSGWPAALILDHLRTTSSDFEDLQKWPNILRTFISRVHTARAGGAEKFEVSLYYFTHTQELRQLPKLKNLTDDLTLFDNTAHGRDVPLVAHFQAGERTKKI